MNPAETADYLRRIEDETAKFERLLFTILRPPEQSGYIRAMARMTVAAATSAR